MNNFSKREFSILLEAIDKWARCGKAASFEAIFEGLSSLLPYEMSCCAIGDSISLTVDRAINNKFPSDYLQIKLAKGMLQKNPFVHETLTLMRPRFWNIEDYKDKPAYKEFVRIDKDFGLTRGLSSAFSEADGKSTYLLLANPNERPHERHLQIVDFLMPHLHHTINRIYGSHNGNGNLNSLTMRELEVLKWVMEGKTNWEISVIMSISEATVKFHLLNIFRKLDVVNRGHAVAKALQIAPHIFL